MVVRCDIELQVIESLAVCKLRGQLDVAAAREVFDKLTTELSPEHDVLVHLEEVERIDAAGVQLLLALRARAQGAKRNFRTSVTDGPVKRAIETAGAKALLEDHL